MRKGKHYHCPVNGWDCPYYIDSKEIEGETEYCLCGIDVPIEECDDFYGMWGDCEEDDYTDYIEE